MTKKERSQLIKKMQSGTATVADTLALTRDLDVAVQRLNTILKRFRNKEKLTKRRK